MKEKDSQALKRWHRYLKLSALATQRLCVKNANQFAATILRRQRIVSGVGVCSSLLVVISTLPKDSRYLFAGYGLTVVTILCLLAVLDPPPPQRDLPRSIRDVCSDCDGEGSLPTNTPRLRISCPTCGSTGFEEEIFSESELNELEKSLFTTKERGETP